MRAVDLLASGRALIQAESIYFLSLVHGLVPYETREVRTAGVTPGMVFYYNPDYIESLFEEARGSTNVARTAASKTAFVQLHEGQHVLRRHFERRGLRDQALWNRATDFSINNDLRAMGWIPPTGALLPNEHGLPEGLTAEEYYDLLLQQQEQKQGPGKPQEQSGKQDPNAQQKASGSGAPGDEGGSGQDDKEGEGGACSGCCGSGAGNTDGTGLQDLERKIDAEMGRAQVDCDRLEKQVANDINQHVQQYGRGKLPGNLTEWAQKALEPPKVRWEKELAHILRATCGRLESGGHDYSFSRISKRSFTRRLIRPGMVSYMPEGCVILDTSGSMNKKQLEIGLRETAGVLAGLGVPRIWFLQADTRVAAEPKLIKTRELQNIEIKGRGGTSFIQALEAVTRLRPRPAFVIYFTDGDGDAPNSPPPGVDVIWAIVPGRDSREPPCSWGRVVWIKE